MKKNKNQNPYPLLLFLIIYFLLYSCHQKKDNTTNDSKKDNFCITDTMQKLISIDTVRMGKIENELNLSGKIQAIPSKNIKIYPLISGIVKNLYVEVGDYVQEGQPLAEIISSEVAEFEKELADAEANLQIAKKNLNVAKDMYEGKLISEKEYITAQKDYEKAEAELKRLQSIFNMYHISSAGVYTLKSPISGYIITKNISTGMQIRADNDAEMMSIADINKLWVIANVYESDMRNIKVGNDAIIQTIAYPDTLFYGKVNKIFEMLDPTTRTLKIVVELDNKNYLLKPEMFATVKIQYTREKYLPYLFTNATIFDDGKYFAVVYHNPCKIELRVLEIEKKTSNKVFIKSGLKEGERVIVKNNLLIYDALIQ